MDQAHALDAILDLATAALFSPQGADPLHAVLPELRSAIGADAAAYYEHVHGSRTTAVLLTPVDVWARVPFTDTSTELAAQLHPGIKYLITRAPSNPFTVTDLITEHQWRNSELASLMRPDWGENHQLLIPSRPGATPGQTNVFVLGRLERGFSANDRSLTRQLMGILDVVVRLRAALPDLSATLLSQLTERERLVLTLNTGGAAPPEIGARLGISPRTVHKHLEHAYRKLGIHDRHQATTLLTRSRPPDAKLDFATRRDPRPPSVKSPSC
jgi:DNA-binding CsgD family transcriptional regulator